MQLTYLYDVPITVTGQIRKKNEVIRKLQADLHHIEKFSEELIRRTKTDADKQEAADMKNSEGKQAKLQTETNTHRTELQTLVEENREREQQMRLVRRAVVAKLASSTDTKVDSSLLLNTQHSHDSAHSTCDTVLTQLVNCS